MSDHTTRKTTLAPLPVDAFCTEAVRLLRSRGALVLVAEPGAGKTTRIPRALLDAGMAERGQIVVLEPRRLAARMAARRVAEELGEPVGETVGYTVRFEDRSSARTKIRFVTEGVLVRKLAEDPSLRGVACVVLDELHERHLDGDVALACVCALKRGARPDLAVVAMSATLDAERVAEVVGGDVLRVPGRTFGVAIEHAEREDERPLEARVAAAVRELARRESLHGDVLVFLPGGAEIRRAAGALEGFAAQQGWEIAVLHGELSPSEQDRAVCRGSRPKIILSTNVAESSVTIEGVVAVVDSGLARVAGHSPWSGMPTLETRPISRASAAQRAGRAGRVREGRCVRLYTKRDHDSRPAFEKAEILRTDLSSTFLSLACAGVTDPSALPWLDAPPEAAQTAARRLLRQLGALDAEGCATVQGRSMQRLGMQPRPARLAIDAKERGAGARGALLAALLSERDVMEGASFSTHGTSAGARESDVSDLLARLDRFEAWSSAAAWGADTSARAYGLETHAALHVKRVHAAIARSLGVSTASDRPLVEDEEALLLSILAAFPDRVAKSRPHAKHEWVLAFGGSATRAEESVVREAELAVVVDARERRGKTIATMLSAIDPAWVLELFPEDVRDETRVRFDPRTERVEVTKALTYGAIALDESKRDDATGPEVSACLYEAALVAGLDRFFDRTAIDTLRGRLSFARPFDSALPSADEDTMRRVLSAACEVARSFAELRDAGLTEQLKATLEAARAKLDRIAPEHVTLGGGRRCAVNYEPGKPPWIASRLQDFFGTSIGPSVASGRVPLVLHLLGPHQRALQITTDLAGFWDRHYPALRRELMRQYPRHAWPEDPRTVAAPAPKGKRPSV